MMIRVKAKVEAMDVNRLAELIQDPDVHRRVLGQYRGPYSLGVTQVSGGQSNDAALSLSVEGKDSDQFPSHIEIAGERVPVVVNPRWTVPRPLKQRRAS
jgi:hypothetical protein